MTLVVTSVSRHGITVVGDRAASWDHGEETATSLSARKVFVSAAARISVAVWGSTRWPLGNYSQWVEQFVAGLTPQDSLGSACASFAAKVNECLGADANWEKDRRGAHFGGFVDGLPHLYHVHTGAEGQPQMPLAVHRDYPDVHGGGLPAFEKAIASGSIPMLRNGRYDLHALVGDDRMSELRQAFARAYGVPVPGPSLECELWFNATLVRFAAGMMLATGKAPTVSDVVDGFALTDEGRVVDLNAAQGVRIGEKLLLLDAETPPTHSAAI